MIKDIKSSSFLKLNDRFYTKTKAISLKNPRLVSANISLAKQMGIDEKFLETKEFVELLNGEIETDSFASAYTGHQLGYFIPNLGDGRAVLRSSIREYLISEAMYGLGIPTTRALGIITSDTKVHKENIEQGSIVLRVSPSWVRFGSFEFA